MRNLWLTVGESGVVHLSARKSTNPDSETHVSHHHSGAILNMVGLFLMRADMEDMSIK